MEPQGPSSSPELKRMYWHSRRGMLELDLLLVPFAERALGTLSRAQLDLYRDFLAQEDQDLFAWLTGRAVAPTESLREMVALVLEHNDRVLPVQG